MAIRVHGVFPPPMGIEREVRCEGRGLQTTDENVHSRNKVCRVCILETGTGFVAIHANVTYGSCHGMWYYKSSIL